MSRILTATLFVLTLSAPVLADTVPQGAKLFFWEPVGNGDPNAVSCYVGRETPPYRFVSCKRNSDWKRLNANGGGSWDDAGRAMPTQPADSFGTSPRARELSGM